MLENQALHQTSHWFDAKRIDVMTDMPTQIVLSTSLKKDEVLIYPSQAYKSKRDRLGMITK